VYHGGMSTSLPKFIAAIGDPAAAELFDVKLRTVQSWRRRERHPRAEQAARIVELSGGEVDYAGIFAPEPRESA
jgi:hypothetical protein